MSVGLWEPSLNQCMQTSLGVGTSPEVFATGVIHLNRSPSSLMGIRENPDYHSKPLTKLNEYVIDLIFLKSQSKFQLKLLKPEVI